MSTDDRARFEREFTAHLNKWWMPDRRICPICEHTTWQIGDLGEIRSFNGLNPWSVVEPTSRLTPVAMLFCATCGYALHFNALTAGITLAPITIDPPTESIGAGDDE